ncbi:hypothetical protein A3F64_01555 [Candidatus Saccharibacteria bacterium RIFCSPHIGHO2_12_FULL_42_8]|nr:MAG: hypothetical protein A3F64_01555 [Candidatus Saccharibacteria bacterium RIFCSPHIGHO2_12_FULL_42_8]
MFDSLLQIIAPHHCYSCQKTGSVLCSSCIYNIVNDSQNVCIECFKPSLEGICSTCKVPFSKAWFVGLREGELASIIDDFKWARTYDAYKPLALLLDKQLPILPANTVTVPIPTISKHKRVRGYDHIDIICSEFSKQRSLTKRNVLKRKNNFVQHKAYKSERKMQAENSFECNEVLDPNIPYLVVDDIVTTGSTIKAATRVLKGAGAKEVWVAAIARQPLN